MNALQLIQSANSPDEIATLLSAMGQTGPMAAQNVQQSYDPANLPNAAAAEALLRSMGQTTMPNRASAVPADPLFLASGEFFQGDIGRIDSPEAARRLLNSMGQTGPNSQAPTPTEKVPMSPQTSAGMEGASPLQVTPGEEVATAMLSGATQPGQDRGLFPDAFSRPMTGQVNTEGGVERVNAFSQQHGVRAVKDPKTGQVTLTNLDETGKPTAQSQKQVYGFAPLSTNSSASVNTLLSNLRNASDPDAARGVMATLNQSLATEQSRLQAEANTFAERKLGIPALERTLAQAEALDRSMPGYVPGMGDSKNTSAIRTQLYQARNNASGVAEGWLATNIGAAQLRAAASTASAEMKRIENLTASRERRLDASAARAQEREDIAIEQYDTLSMVQKDYVLQLNPQLKAKNDNRADVVNYVKTQMSRDPAFKQLINAAPEVIPDLAVAGNQHAVTIVIQQEMQRTGKSKEQAEAELREVTALSKAGGTAAAWINNQIRNAPPGTDLRALRAELNRQATENANATTKEGRQAAKEASIQMGRDLYRMQKTGKFVSDVNSWGSNDPELIAAADIAYKTTGKRDISSVVTAYVGDSVGPAALAKYKSFQDKIKLGAQRESQSLFGGIDLSAALAVVNAQAVQYGAMARWFKAQHGLPDVEQSMNVPYSPYQGLFGTPSVAPTSSIPTNNQGGQ
ncbi:MAG: hypothetical protein AB7F19_07415 [Candidatus Babeliales bacterium]